MSDGAPTFVLVTGSGAMSFLWNPLIRELVLRGQRTLPVELPGHGFDTVFPPGYGSPQDLEQLASAASPLAGLTLDDYAEHTLAIVRRVAHGNPPVQHAGGVCAGQHLPTPSWGLVVKPTSSGIPARRQRSGFSVQDVGRYSSRSIRARPRLLA